jgi:hypothetical protein
MRSVGSVGQLDEGFVEYEREVSVSGLEHDRGSSARALEHERGPAAEKTRTQEDGTKRTSVDLGERRAASLARLDLDDDALPRRSTIRLRRLIADGS